MRIADRGRWFLNIGARPEESQEQREHRTTMLMFVAVGAPMVLVWSATYAALGFPLTSAIPVAYLVFSAAGLIFLGRTNRLGPVMALQMTMWLALPFLVQWSLGGFVNSSAVALWALGAPMMAMVLGISPWLWLGGFAALTIFSGLIDSTLAASATPMPDGVITLFFVFNFIGVAGAVFVTLLYLNRERDRSRQALRAEQGRSERLLLNILPARIADRLKQGEEPIADRIPQVTVLVADIVGFTPMSERVAAADVVDVLNNLFSQFDDLTDELGLEKLKTIGDAYQAVGGLPGSNPDQVAATADLALAMQGVVSDHAFPGFDGIQLRIGIHTGPVVAGVIGKRKFTYDLWGDTINTASRMESHGVPGQIQVTERVYEELRDRHEFEPRGMVEVKGKGEMQTYFLGGRLVGSAPTPHPATPSGDR